MLKRTSNSRASRRLARFAAHLGVADELHNIHNDGENFGGQTWSRELSEDDRKAGLTANSCAGEGNNGARQITITSHILDTNIGKPAVNVKATLEKKITNSSTHWESIATAKTDNDGRIKTFPALPSVGSYRVVFETGDYFLGKGMENPFYTSVVINFEVQAHEHYHIPLLLAPHGYSTYRGS